MCNKPLDNPLRIVYNNTVRVEKHTESTLQDKQREIKRGCASPRSVTEGVVCASLCPILRTSGGEIPTTLHKPSQTMRKIESQMCAAVQKNIDWKSANTSVHFDPETGVSVVRLHGNKIAEIDDTSMTIFDGGWQSVTTKSRLNALCDEFCIAGEGVFQKDFKWFVRKFAGQFGEKKTFVTEEFSNGYIFA